tara:strand:- start:145 stop:441 length:297 start_codon:yes stop_codon:yes gene_type:complete
MIAVAVAVDVKMNKPLSADSTISLSVAMLLKLGFILTIIFGSYYQAQLRFNTLDLKMSELHSEVTILNEKMANIEAKKLQNLEAENKTLMEKIGLKKR